MYKLHFYLLIALFSLSACCECIDGGEDADIDPYRFSSENFEECGLSGIYLQYDPGFPPIRIELRDDGTFWTDRSSSQFWSGRFDCNVITIYQQPDNLPTIELEIVEIRGDSLILLTGSGSGSGNDNEVWVKQ